MRFASLAVALALGQGTPATWKRQSLTPEFSVDAPTTLKAVVKSDASKSFPKGMRYWSGKHAAAVFSAMAMPITDKDRRLATPPLEAFAQGMARPGDGVITGRRTLSLPGGIRGIQWDQENALLRSRWRAYEYKNTILAASVLWRAKSVTPLDMGRYLESMLIRPR